MKFDEEDLLDLINGPLNSPSQKDQKDIESNKNDDLLQNDREPDIISTLLLPEINTEHSSTIGTPRSLKEEKIICGVQCYSVIGTSHGTGRVDTIQSLLYFDNTRTSITKSEERDRCKQVELTLKNPFIGNDFEDSSGDEDEDDEDDEDIQFISFELEEPENESDKEGQDESDSESDGSISESSDVPFGPQDEESLQSLIENPIGPSSAGFLVPSVEPCSQSHSGSTNNLLENDFIETKSVEDQIITDDEEINKKKIVFQINSAFNEIEIEKTSQVHEPLVYSDIQNSFDNISIQSLVVDETPRRKRKRFKSFKRFFKLVFACTRPVKS